MWVRLIAPSRSTFWNEIDGATANLVRECRPRQKGRAPEADRKHAEGRPAQHSSAPGVLVLSRVLSRALAAGLLTQLAQLLALTTTLSSILRPQHGTALAGLLALEPELATHLLAPMRPLGLDLLQALRQAASLGLRQTMVMEEKITAAARQAVDRRRNRSRRGKRRIGGKRLCGAGGRRVTAVVGRRRPQTGGPPRLADEHLAGIA